MTIMGRKLIVFGFLFVAIIAGSNAVEGPAGAPMSSMGSSYAQSPQPSNTIPVAAAPKPYSASSDTFSPKVSAPMKAPTPVSKAPIAATPEEEPSSPPDPTSQAASSPVPTTDAPVSAPSFPPEFSPSDTSAATVSNISSALLLLAIAGFFSL